MAENFEEAIVHYSRAVEVGEVRAMLLSVSDAWGPDSSCLQHHLSAPALAKVYGITANFHSFILDHVATTQLISSPRASRREEISSLPAGRAARCGSGRHQYLLPVEPKICKCEMNKLGKGKADLSSEKQGRDEDLSTRVY